MNHHNALTNYKHLVSKLKGLRATAPDDSARDAYDRAIAETEKAFLLPRFTSEAKEEAAVLTGQDASVLALLAQSPGLHVDAKRGLVDRLEGRAKVIAEILAGFVEGEGRDLEAAEGYRRWAASLPRR